MKKFIHISSLTELFRFFLLMVLKNFHTNSLSVNRLENCFKTGKIQIIWFRYLIGLLSITFLFACGDTGSEQKSNELATVEDLAPSESEENKNIDYQALADAYCKCSKHTVEINDKMKRLMEMTVPDNAELEKLYPKVDKAFKKAIECSREAKEKQTSGEISNKLLVKPMKQTCPDLPSALVMKLLVTEIK